MKKKLTYIVAAILVLCTACNNKEKSSIARITSFDLYSSDFEDLLYTDFTIDEDNKRIYNVDSCEYGTNLDRVMPVMYYETTPYSVSFDGEKWSGDTLSLSTNFTVTVMASDRKTTSEYTVQVNIHTIDADSIRWRRIGYNIIPTDNVIDTKAVCLNGLKLLFVQYADGTGAAYSSRNCISWSQLCTYSETIDVMSVTVYESYTDGDIAFATSADRKTLYMFDMESAQFKAVTTPYSTVYDVVGTLFDNILLMVDNGSGIQFATYDLNEFELLRESDLDDRFPVSGAAKATANGEAYYICGIDSNGECGNGVFGTELGYYWPNLQKDPSSTYGLPECSFLTVVPVLNSMFAIGGITCDGNIINTVYRSDDYGFSWKKGKTSQQLPDGYTPRHHHSSFLDKNGNIWIIGGKDKDGELVMDVWRGHLNRYDFKRKY